MMQRIRGFLVHSFLVFWSLPAAANEPIAGSFSIDLSCTSAERGSQEACGNVENLELSLRKQVDPAWSWELGMRRRGQAEGIAYGATVERRLTRHLSLLLGNLKFEDSQWVGASIHSIALAWSPRIRDQVAAVIRYDWEHGFAQVFAGTGEGETDAVDSSGSFGAVVTGTAWGFWYYFFEATRDENLIPSLDKERQPSDRGQKVDRALLAMGLGGKQPWSRGLRALVLYSTQRSEDNSASQISPGTEAFWNAPQWTQADDASGTIGAHLYRYHASLLSYRILDTYILRAAWESVAVSQEGASYRTCGQGSASKCEVDSTEEADEMAQTSVSWGIGAQFLTGFRWILEQRYETQEKLYLAHSFPSGDHLAKENRVTRLVLSYGNQF